MGTNWMLLLNITNAALGIAVVYFLGKIILSVIKDIGARKVERQADSNIPDYRKVA
jgi:hypothetical protein